jgi:hypothetical protein
MGGGPGLLAQAVNKERKMSANTNFIPEHFNRFQAARQRRRAANLNQDPATAGAFADCISSK